MLVVVVEEGEKLVIVELDNLIVEVSNNFDSLLHLLLPSHSEPFLLLPFHSDSSYHHHYHSFPSHLNSLPELD